MRKHQKLEDPRFLYWFDRKGLLVWSEMGAAYGGIAFMTEKGWGYGNQVKTEEEFLTRYRNITQAIRDLDYVCGFCYTQLTDVQQELNGLLTIDREPKIAL
ncbi:hypothetical protein SAMN04487897_102833 [Paenibacillus sp. yr247]|nr:hypothetical protein SAMN04487897_102833 [Paenibacillus sp. yr247]